MILRETAVFSKQATTKRLLFVMALAIMILSTDVYSQSMNLPIGLNRLKVVGGVGFGVDNILLENGDNLLLESGSPDVLLLE